MRLAPVLTLVLLVGGCSVLRAQTDAATQAQIQALKREIEALKKQAAQPPPKPKRKRRRRSSGLGGLFKMLGAVKAVRGASKAATIPSGGLNQASQQEVQQQAQQQAQEAMARVQKVSESLAALEQSTSGGAGSDPQAALMQLLGSKVSSKATALAPSGGQALSAKDAAKAALLQSLLSGEKIDLKGVATQALGAKLGGGEAGSGKDAAKAALLQSLLSGEKLDLGQIAGEALQTKLGEKAGALLGGGEGGSIKDVATASAVRSLLSGQRLDLQQIAGEALESKLGEKAGALLGGGESGSTKDALKAQLMQSLLSGDGVDLQGLVAGTVQQKLGGVVTGGADTSSELSTKAALKTALLQQLMGSGGAATNTLREELLATAARKTGGLTPEQQAMKEALLGQASTGEVTDENAFEVDVVDDAVLYGGEAARIPASSPPSESHVTAAERAQIAALLSGGSSPAAAPAAPAAPASADSGLFAPGTASLAARSTGPVAPPPVASPPVSGATSATQIVEALTQKTRERVFAEKGINRFSSREARIRAEAQVTKEVEVTLGIREPSSSSRSRSDQRSQAARRIAKAGLRLNVKQKIELKKRVRARVYAREKITRFSPMGTKRRADSVVDFEVEQAILDGSATQILTEE